MEDEILFLAKSDGKTTIRIHTDDVLRSANEIFKLYPDKFTEIEKELILIACEVHDYGKMDQNFQFILKGESNSVEETRRHEFISTLCVDFKQLKKKYGAINTKSLLSSIYYGHRRLYSESELREYCKKYVEKNAEIFMRENDVSLFNESKKLHYANTSKLLFNATAGVDGTRFNEGLDEEKKKEKYLAYLLYVTIVGILNKADYHASSMSENPIERAIPTGEKGLPYLVTKEFIDNGYDFYEAQRFLLNNRGNNVILIAPAGSGKTEGSLLWLGEQKGFYTLPIKVSSNAIFDRIRERYQYDEVALLHSDALTHLLKTKSGNEKDEDWKLQEYEMMKKLSYPMTVCTVDQIFKFVFKSLGTEILAATLKYSCVIVDEIQMYSPKMMAMLCYGLKMVNDLGGKFLIMTATLPPMVKEYFDDKGVKFESDEFKDLKSGVRHCVEVIQGEFDYNLIMSQATKKVLILCNTVKKAQQVYLELSRLNSNGVTVQLLHSNFTKGDRQLLENEILSFAKNGKQGGSGIWISTQIVEASLDIDFDFLHTEMCTIDSLFQRMGRCYRSRTYNENTPNIFVYNTENGKGEYNEKGELKGIYDPDIYEYSLEAICEYQGKRLTEEDKMNMVAKVFDIKQLNDKPYYLNFKKNLKYLEEIYPGQFSKGEGDDYFREINATTIIPESVYQQKENDVLRWIEEYEDKKLSIKERHDAKEKILQECLSVRTVVKSKIVEPLKLKGIEIYRYDCEYDFDKSKKTGKGLVLKEFK